LESENAGHPVIFEVQTNNGKIFNYISSIDGIYLFSKYYLLPEIQI